MGLRTRTPPGPLQGDQLKGVQHLVGQAAALALVTAIAARSLKSVWVVPVLVVTLWHEPLVEVLYHSESNYGPASQEYYGLAIRAALVAMTVPAIHVLLQRLTGRLAAVPA